MYLTYLLIRARAPMVWGPYCNCSVNFSSFSFALRATFHVQVWNLVDTCNSPIPTKKSLGAKSVNPTGSEIFWIFLCKIFAVFAISRCTLTNSPYSFNQINIIYGQSNLKAFATLNCEDLEFSLKGVSVVDWQSSMFCHETVSCCNSGNTMSDLPQTFIRVLAWTHLHGNIQLQS